MPSAVRPRALIGSGRPPASGRHQQADQVRQLAAQRAGPGPARGRLRPAPRSARTRSAPADSRPCTASSTSTSMLRASVRAPAHAALDDGEHRRREPALDQRPQSAPQAAAGSARRVRRGPRPRFVSGHAADRTTVRPAPLGQMAACSSTSATITGCCARPCATSPSRRSPRSPSSSTRPRAFPTRSSARLGELDLMGIPYPEEYGGAGGDSLAYALAVEELARVDSSVAITLCAHTSLGHPAAVPVRLRGAEAAMDAAPVRRASGSPRSA